MKRKIVASISVIMTVCLLLVGTLPATRSAQFVLSAWSFPDDYGQGIQGFNIWENSTGSWLKIRKGPFNDFYYYSEAHIYEWNESVAIKLWCECYFNSTLTGVGDSTEGKNYLQHSVSVTNRTGGTIFSQQNFTYLSVNDATYDPIWVYTYEVVLDFLPDYGQMYTVTVTYEIFW